MQITKCCCLLFVLFAFPITASAIDIQDVNTGQYANLMEYTNLQPGEAVSFLDYYTGDIHYGIVQNYVVVHNQAVIYIYDHSLGGIREFYLENYNNLNGIR